jgi:hypothetical protein
MLLGVLRMPPELWTDSPIDVQQRHARYMQAAAHIEYLQAELAEARQERDLLREFMRDACADLKCEQNDEAALLAIEELREEVERLRRDAERLRDIFRANMLRYVPGVPHEQISAALDGGRCFVNPKPIAAIDAARKETL